MSYLHPRKGLSRRWDMGCLHLRCLRHDWRCQGFYQGSIVPFRGTEGPTSFSQLTTCHGTCQISNCQRCTYPKCLIFHIHFGREKDGMGNFSRTHILKAVFKKVAFETESFPRFCTQRPSRVQQNGWFFLFWTRRNKERVSMKPLQVWFCGSHLNLLNYHILWAMSPWLSGLQQTTSFSIFFNHWSACLECEISTHSST